MRRDDFDNWRMRLDQLGEYVEKVRQAQKEHPGLEIKLALEVDYLPGQEDWIRDLAARHPWDYFIGSVHYVSGYWAVDNPEQLSRWKQADPFEVWSLYFERLTQAAESGLFEIIGHADLPKKFNIRPKQDCAPLFRRFLDAVKTSDIAIELNTAGLRKDCREIYPSRAFLELAAQKSAHHLRLRRARAGGSRRGLWAGGGAGARGGLDPLSPLLPAPPPPGEDRMVRGQGCRRKVPSASPPEIVVERGRISTFQFPFYGVK